MRYEGAEAYRLESVQKNRAHSYEAQLSAPSFEVYEGGGLDARARQGVDSRFISRVRALFLLAVVVVIVGSIRVGLCAATVSVLQVTSGLQSKVESLKDINSQLEIECSVAGSSQRITSIATQNYGMVYASEVDTIKLAPADAKAGGTKGAATATAATGSAASERQLTSAAETTSKVER